MTYTFYTAAERVRVWASTASEARRKFYRRKGFFPGPEWEVTASTAAAK